MNKKQSTKVSENPGQDIVIDTLKKKYFEVASKENYPHTPDLTKELDNLEGAIKELNNRTTKELHA